MVDPCWTWIVALALASAVSGCRDQPAVVGADAAPSSAAVEGGGARSRPGRLSPQTQKQSRVDACTFGTLALFDLRDTYLQSLGGKEPGPGHLPVLGPELGLPPESAEPVDPAEQEAKTIGSAASAEQEANTIGSAATAEQEAKTIGSASPAEHRRKRPPPLHPVEPRSATGEFVLPQAVRTCTVARKLSQPSAPELDTELGRFEPLVTALHGKLAEAGRYYQSRAYEQDGFARGRALHAELVRAFESLEPQWIALHDANERWRSGLGPAPDPLDPEGEIANRAVVAARAITTLLVARAAPEAAALERATTELADATRALGELARRAPRSAFVRGVLPPIEALGAAIDAAKAARTAAAAVPPREARALALRYASVADEWSRALSRALGVRGKRSGGSTRGARSFGGRRRPPHAATSAPASSPTATSAPARSPTSP